MALVVESTSTVSASNADNVTITKPTGVAVGDLLFIVASGWQTNLPTCSGFTNAATYSVSVGGTIVAVGMLYRIADASDVSASNYTVAIAGSATSSGIASMFRISGWTSGNPVLVSATGNGSADGITSSGATGLTLVRPQPQLLVLANVFQSTSGALSSATFSGYSITSANSNPTWTELQDTQIAVLAGAANVAMSVAYASSSDTSTITDYTTTVSSDTNGDADAVISLLAVICEPSNETADVSHLDSAPTIFGPTVSQVNVSLDMSHNAVTPTVSGIDAYANAPTVWENETKPSTTWVNEDK